MQTMKLNNDAFSALHESEMKQIAHYSVGFVILQSTDNREDGLLGGSGTLVSIDGKEGVLTASHVVRTLQRQEIAGIILSSNREGAVHQVLFKTGDCCEFSFGPPPNPSNAGPDLSFLELPPSTTETLRAKKSFYNLTIRRDLILDESPPRHHGFWSVLGMAAEWTSDVPDPSGFGRVKAFHGKLIGPLDGMAWRSSGHFDYIDFEVLYDDGYGGPDDFGGYSGGGIWQFVIKSVEGVPKVAKRYLMGSAFYQSGKTERDGKAVRTVTCHGPESVYRMLIDGVQDGTTC